MTTIVSLFSGIGGLELGLRPYGYETELFCELDEAAATVLSHHFPDVALHSDVQTLSFLPQTEILTAGFPCQDLSLAGDKAGLGGQRSGLIGEVFRLVAAAKQKPRWLIFENVPYMLLLNGGSGMASLVTELENQGYKWAYRVVDARSFGLPQRRQRVLLLASQSEDPRDVLFCDESQAIHVEHRPSKVAIGPAYGFYWTMGKMGAGWVREATPPIKGGSNIGIPSPPAIWLSSQDFFGTPSIEDAERLQGFEGGWTASVLDNKRLRPSARWRLVGNAVCPPMAAWVGARLAAPGQYDSSRDVRTPGKRWPKAAYGLGGDRVGVHISEWPLETNTPTLEDFLKAPLNPLSLRATKGFLARAVSSKEIAWAPAFLDSLSVHIDRHSQIQLS